MFVWGKALASDLSLPVSSNPSSNVQSQHACACAVTCCLPIVVSILCLCVIRHHLSYLSLASR